MRDPTSRCFITRFWAFVVVGHFEASSFETAFDVKPLIGLATVENAFVTTDLFCHMIESLDDSQSQFLALLIFGHSNIFDVADESHVVNELPLHDDGAGTHYG